METFTDWRTWGHARADLAGRSPASESLSMLDVAFEAARDWHGPQRRPTGAPYVEHLLEAVEVLVRGAGVTDPEILAAALLHDVVEDTDVTVPQVEARFGPVVAELVDWVTKPPAGGQGRQAKRAAKTAYLRRLREAPPEAITVKLADRVSNVQTLDRMPVDFQRRYYVETVTYVIPLTSALDGPVRDWFTAWYTSWQGRFAHLG